MRLSWILSFSISWISWSYVASHPLPLLNSKKDCIQVGGDSVSRWGRLAFSATRQLFEDLTASLWNKPITTFYDILLHRQMPSDISSCTCIMIYSRPKGFLKGIGYPKNSGNYTLNRETYNWFWNSIFYVLQIKVQFLESLLRFIIITIYKAEANLMWEGEGIFSVILWCLLLFQMVWEVNMVSLFILKNYI